MPTLSLMLPSVVCLLSDSSWDKLVPQSLVMVVKRDLRVSSQIWGARIFCLGFLGVGYISRMFFSIL